MADNENLRTASLYINNQLLSRGLLRDGQTINFADPEDNPGGTEATMGSIMSIVNDLILRRDRDAEHRENLSATLRNVRAENLRYTNDLSRLSEKQTETQRKLDISEATENTLRTQLKSADAAVRGLKEEVARAKTLVAQTRASCATEVRRRDRQIDGLKKQLGDAGRPRGAAKSSAVTVISVVAGEGDEKASARRQGKAGASTDDSDYDLRSETNEFLTDLARSLSEENEALLGLVRRTTKSLREMSGCDARTSQGDGYAVALPTAEDMASELDAILEHLRSILTNPSFAPIEEVEVREEEIARLRAGWVKMESRWQEAVHLIDGWRRRMVVDGKSVNMEELKMGLRLSPVRVRDVEETQQGGMDVQELSCVREECTADLDEDDADENDEDEDEEEAMPDSPCPAPHRVESLHLVPAPDQHYAAPHEEEEYDDEIQQSDRESSIFEDVDVEDLDIEEPNVQILQQSTAMISSPPLPPPPQLSPLRETASAGNRDARPRREKQDGHHATAEEKTRTVRTVETAPPKPPPHLVQFSRSPQKPSQQADHHHRAISAASVESDSTHNGAPLITPSGTPPPEVDQTPTARKLPKPPRLVAAAPAVFAPKEALSTVRTVSQESQESQTSQESCDGEPPAPAVQPNSNSSKAASPHRTPLRRVPSRLPLPRPSDPPPQQSPLTLATIAAKLAASEREADAARVRAKLRAARGGALGKSIPATREQLLQQQQQPMPPVPPPPETIVAVPAEPEQPNGSPARTRTDRDLDPVKRDLPQAEDQGRSPLQPARRKRERRASKVASRRRSTLSPWEMESLISGTVAVPPSPAR
ncbi:Afadin and alpha-actinin-binding-domain-containing protein [Colletotrichum navitas]|uniref:Afadin and alpha-actinin-binding-domain-containing protein n=1 Tax=Colletotrichum navitas TaxID=681940 RepID=A0AAD8PY80_9PEZI|nr:Afadin and alpha-actinin-binding-domain-containing protein [Colletotrichum navitas]KAK1589720.1 Afadin and alpha-actinin-binding-domain-containing protein [Colletotrichum navitas]